MKKTVFSKQVLLTAAAVALLAGAGYAHTWMCQWTPGGWASCLGAKMHKGYVGGGPISGTEWLRETQVRERPEEHRKSLRARLIGDALAADETDQLLWHALAEQMRTELVPEPQEARAQDEAPARAVQVPADLKAATVDGQGVITVPAVACTVEGDKPEPVLFMNSSDKGMQMHLCRLGEDPEKTALVYRVEAPRAGTYHLTAKVVSIHNGIGLNLSVNGATDGISLPVPYTVGLWGKSKAVTVTLAEGTNTLRFTGQARNPPVTIKHFVLTPVNP